MKIKVELDVDPNEVDLVHELIKTLRSITDHVKVNQKTDARTATKPSTSAQSPASAKSAASPRIASVPPDPSPAAAVQPDAFAAALSASLAPNPVPVFQQPQPPQAQQPEPAFTSPQAVNGYANGRPAAPAFKSWLALIVQASESRDPSAQDETVELIIKALPSQLDSPEDKACFDKFMAALEEALWANGPDGSNTASQVVPLCYILPQLPEIIKDEAKKQLINKAMKHLMMKRPVDADRSEFFAHATAFAAMVQLELVLVPGAVQTITSLLKKELTCCAAITMLGKTVELCYSQLKEHCEAEKLEKLQAAVQAVNHTAFQYDIEYIMSTMGWDAEAGGAPTQQQESAIAGHSNEQPAIQAPPPAAASVSQNEPLLKLQPQRSWGGYGGPVKAVAVDAARSQIISLSFSSLVLVHSFDGRELHRLEAQSNAFTDMDFNHQSSLLALAGQNQGSAEIVSYSVDSSSLHRIGAGPPSHSDAKLTHLRFLTGSETVLVAMGVTEGGQVLTVLEIVQLAGVSPDGKTTTLNTFKLADQGMMTSMMAIPSSGNAFLTAHKTGVVYLWNTQDSRAPFGKLVPPHYGKPITDNVGVITCLEVLGGLVLAGAFGQGVHVWDLRQIQKGNDLTTVTTVNVCNSTVTRLVRGPRERQAVVAAVDTIHTIQFNDDGSLDSQVAGVKVSEKFYYDAKWSLTGSPRLYAASAGSTVDVYEVV